MRKLKKGDEIVVITGKDKGKRGIVASVMRDDKVLVENMNLVKKHVRPNPSVGESGGIVEKEMPMDISNVAIFNPATGKADRVGIKLLDDGRKVRIFKSNQETIDA